MDDPSKPIVARRGQIVQSAVDTILWWLARSGPDSFADVLARHARLGSAAVVRHHFADRDELLAEIHRTLLTRFSRLAEPRITVETTPQGRARALVSAAVDYLHRSHRDAFALRVMAVETRTPGGWFTKTVPPQVAAVKDVIRRGQAAGQFRRFDPHAVAEALIGLSDAVRRNDAPTGSDTCRRTLLELTRVVE